MDSTTALGRTLRGLQLAVASQRGYVGRPAESDMHVFLSCENIADAIAQRLIALLRKRRIELDHSPMGGDDPRFVDWYARGCTAAISRADVAVAVVTAGWNGSTWMAHEADTALTMGKPLHCWNPGEFMVPLGMLRFTQQMLAADAGAAVEQLVALHAL